MACVEEALVLALTDKLADISPADLVADYEMVPAPEELEGNEDFIVDGILDFNGVLGQALLKWVQNFQASHR